MASERRPRRSDRLYPDRPSDNRRTFERDYDRILYSSAFRRLAGVTQVVSAAEGHIFHNRLTHTMKVAQIGRRMAQKLLRDEGGPDLAATWGGLSPSVVAAAGLAHDLGHPPFGHVAEEELERLSNDLGLRDGFQGNAQSFRIVSRLSRRHIDFWGLNLSRASLNATLKYPRFRNHLGLPASDKWGAYQFERTSFDFARAMDSDDRRSLEAEIMDWADDVAYAVHDVEDFFRSGLIPLDMLKRSPAARDAFLRWAFDNWDGTGRKLPSRRRARMRGALQEAILQFPLSRPYSGSATEAALLRSFTSSLIGSFVWAISIRQSGKTSKVHINLRARDKVAVLKRLTRYYVIQNPTLAAQQEGKRRVISNLFEAYMDAMNNNRLYLLPPFHKESYEDMMRREESDVVRQEEARARVVIDLICGMTDEQAVRMSIRLTGTDLGSVLDPIV